MTPQNIAEQWKCILNKYDNQLKVTLTSEEQAVFHQFIEYTLRQLGQKARLVKQLAKELKTHECR